MERGAGERPVTVDNKNGIVVIGDGNRVVVGAVPVVRSGYWEQVRRIAPAELPDRKAELAELAAFCRAEPGYLWWRADAWAGKTALLSWFALNPPPGVRIVPFFVTARWAGQNDSVAYVDVVLEQLAELTGEPLPALLTAATREAHLLRLHASAARACAERGERLVLLVDGLDEDRGVTTGPDTHSIAALLPSDAHVIVSGRLNPPLPPDVPDDHPLRDPAVVRILAPSPQARAIRFEAERELKRLLAADGLPYDLLALLTAAGGGLTADDLAELTGEERYEIRDVLRTGPGRTFALRGDAYLLGHEELAAAAREMLGEAALDRWRDVLHYWAENWRDRGWPERTPAYLLHGYVPMLRMAGDVDRMVTCALDEARHDRLVEVTGGVGAPLGEVRTAGEAVLEGAEPAGLLTTMLRLAVRRADLLRGSFVPDALAASWAAAGQLDRALAQVRTSGGQAWTGGLCAVARRLLAVGDRERAAELVAEIEAITFGSGSRVKRDMMVQELVPLLLEAGEFSRAERAVRTLEKDHDRIDPLLALVDALCAAEEFDKAIEIVNDEDDDRLYLRAVDRVIRGLLAAGHAEEAVQSLREVAEDAEEMGIAVLLDGSRALRDAGYEAWGAALRAMALRAFDAGVDARSRETVRALVAVGEYERLDRWLGWSEQGLTEWGVELARGGAWDLARRVAAGTTEPQTGWITHALVETAFDMGCLDEVEATLEAEGTYAEEWDWERLAKARLRAGELDKVGALISAGDDLWDEVIAEYARTLCHAGRREQATALRENRLLGPLADIGIADAHLDAGERSAAVELLTSAERALRRSGPKSMTAVLLAVVEGLARVGGQEATARALLADVERYGTAVDVSRLLPALVATGQLDRAEELARSLGDDLDRGKALEKVVVARAAEGAYEAVVRLVEGHWPPYGFLFATAVRELVNARAWPYVVPLLRARGRSGTAGPCAVLAWRLARDGHLDAAAQWLDEATRQAAAAEFDASVVPELVGACFALGRREEAWERLRRARAQVNGPYRSFQAAHIARALVLLGAYDAAVDYAREVAPENATDLLLSVAGDLVAADEYDRAAEILAGLHSEGYRCASVYADLARAHTDPARARAYTALALHVGGWYDVLPAVFRCEPDALPLVLAEADRLRRALQI
ncbi:hypothetical protein ACIRSU_23920 [Streptomyces sp. NPDC101160]|uniref:hypothetical protein n=1 Tax=Streptomyces sp. NPDC101160 TaxID=3366118 RepID=UPI003811CCB0